MPQRWAELTTPPPSPHSQRALYNQGRPIERVNERSPGHATRVTHNELRERRVQQDRPPASGDPWYYAPLSGECYHLERNCLGLRNARNVQTVLPHEAQNRLVMQGLRPCRLCASQDRRGHHRRRPE